MKNGPQELIYNCTSLTCTRYTDKACFVIVIARIKTDESHLNLSGEADVQESFIHPAIRKMIKSKRK